VEKDALLVRLDTSAEVAQLGAITAQVHLATITLDRASNLLKDKMVSQAEYDAAKANLEQLQANAEAVVATIGKKTIRAPFAGLLGIRQVNLGQYVESGKAIVSLQSLDTVYADFSLPQQDLAQLKSGMVVRLHTDAYPGKVFEGTLSAINPDLDASTRSVGLQATFNNPEHLLRPGMFARVEVLLPEHNNVVVVPNTAILKAPYGDSVYVVENQAGTNSQPGLTVRQQFVRVGRSRGDFVAIESGVKPGQKVVSAGVFKLRNGMSIVENNELTPKTALSPRPSDS
jgi:membrane fusion protein (multidrug efflux system)